MPGVELPPLPPDSPHGSGSGGSFDHEDDDESLSDAEEASGLVRPPPTCLLPEEF